MQADTVERRGATLLLKDEFINAAGGGERSRVSDGGEGFWWRWRLGICSGRQTHGKRRQEKANRKASIANADGHAGIQLAVAPVFQNAELAPAGHTWMDVDRLRIACKTG